MSVPGVAFCAVRVPPVIFALCLLYDARDIHVGEVFTSVNMYVHYALLQ